MRDWSKSGEQIRVSLYNWCIQQLQAHLVQNNDNFSSIHINILVPGAGLGEHSIVS